MGRLLSLFLLLGVAWAHTSGIRCSAIWGLLSFLTKYLMPALEAQISGNPKGAKGYVWWQPTESFASVACHHHGIVCLFFRVTSWLLDSDKFCGSLSSGSVCAEAEWDPRLPSSRSTHTSAGATSPGTIRWLLLSHTTLTCHSWIPLALLL